MDLSPLAKLPAELRHDIYKLVLYKAGGIFLRPGYWAQGRVVKRCHHKVCSMQRQEDKPDHHTINVLALAQTCKQVRTESSLLFFALNKFYLMPGTSAIPAIWCKSVDNLYRQRVGSYKLWLQEIGEQNANAILQVMISSEGLAPLSEDNSPRENTEWWRSARKIEREILDSDLEYDKVYSVVTISMEHKRIWHKSPHTCSNNGEKTILKFDDLIFTLPVNSEVAAREEVERKFKERAAVLESHRSHRRGCTIYESRHDVFRPLERSWQFMKDTIKT